MKNISHLIKYISIVLIISIAGITTANATDEDGTASLLPLTANPAPIPSVAGSIGTLFGRDNGLSGPNDGMFFEIENVGIKPVTISSWDINTETSTSVDVYTRVGTYVGFQLSTAGWTLLGTDNAVVSQGQDQPTPVAVGGLTIAPGQTVGIAMVSDGDWDYTNGTGTNQVFNNGELELRLGSSADLTLTAGGTVFEPRVWNGVVHYDVAATAVPSLGLWGLVLFALLLLGFASRKLIK